MPLSDSKMKFIVRRAQAEDAEAVGQFAKEFIDYLRSIGDEDAEQKFDAGAYLRDGSGSNPAFSGLEAGFTKNLPYMRLEV